MVSVAVIVLYVWSSMFGEGLGSAFGHIVSLTSVALASLTALVSAVLYLWTPKNNIVLYSLGVYLLLAVSVGYLVYESGGVESPFIALWMIVAVFSGVFGVFTLLPISVVVATYAVLYFIEIGRFEPDTLLSVLFAGALPLIVSHITWHRQGEHEAGKDRAYRELANELSQVSGKSDVVINAIADGVVAIDSQGVIELINPAAQQIIGWQRQDAVGLNYKSVLKLLNSTNKEPAPSEDPVAQSLSTNKAIRNDKLTLLTESKKKLLVSIVVSPIGQVGSGAIIVFRDVTKEKAEERQQAEFISTASHEMRTPVASIEGYLGLALNPATASIDEKARDYIGKAHEAAQHLGRLFQDLLDISKAEDGRLKNDPAVVDVVEFAYGVVEGLRPKAEEKGLRLLYKPKPDKDEHTAPQQRSFMRTSLGEKTLTPVYYANLDNDHLREVIANLVENAIKYTLKGDVVVDVVGDDEHIKVSVQDSGIGIPAEDMPHLFQKFYRVDNTATREIGGTGLGLYLSRRLAETMSGRIWAESEYNQGSTFFLEVPRIDHEEAMRRIEAKAEESSSAPQIIPAHTPQPIAQPTTYQTPGVPAPAQPQPIAPSAPPQPVPYVSPTMYQQPTAPIQQPRPPVLSHPSSPVAPAPQLQAAPAPQAPQQPQPSVQQPGQYVTMARRQLQNTPLSSIERDPTQYASYPGRQQTPPRPPQ